MLRHMTDHRQPGGTPGLMRRGERWEVSMLILSLVACLSQPFRVRISQYIGSLLYTQVAHVLLSRLHERYQSISAQLEKALQNILSI